MLQAAKIWISDVFKEFGIIKFCVLNRKRIIYHTAFYIFIMAETKNF
jgi:hypothetical protein